uniref:Transient receptor potential cation channel, subfamily V, member 1 n=1 Tax=Takifugu rubripes TaxID=31033 RepID=A0A674MI93_TAKRU
MEEPKDQLRYNPNFDKGIRGLDDKKRESDIYNISRLFEAVARRDVDDLANLHQYLHRNMKNLSDSLYQSYGKSALMKALLHLKDGKNETVEWLIHISEEMGDLKTFVNLAYTSAYYKGQTALHVAIERRSLSYVKLLVSKGADVHAKASGTFFQPHSGPSFYFGELPLSLAACTNQPAMVDFLMDNKYQPTDPNKKDSHGNTVLHALVAVADNSEENTKFITSMYDHILVMVARLYPKLKLEDIQNNNGLTPLTMATKTGKSGLFSHILKREFQENDTKHLSRKFTEWVYGPVTCSLYDLASVDSYQKNSALEILVYGSNVPNRHEMLQTAPLGQLLESKWKKFAGHMFCLNFLFYLVYLIVFTAVAYNKNEGQVSLQQHLLGLVGEDTPAFTDLCIVLLPTMVSICWTVHTCIVTSESHTAIWCDRSAVVSLFQGTLFMISAGLYLMEREEFLGFLVVCLALSWVNLLYFSRGDKHMGIYSIMIQKMILGDILRFLFVYAVFLFGFSAGIVCYNGAECVKPTYRNISYTTLQLFKFTIGMGDMEFTEHYKYKEVFYVLLIGYIILTYILLLNMLIALMNRTVEKTTMESTSIWQLQRAFTIMDMERRIPYCLKSWFRCGVKKNLGSGWGDDHRWCFRVEEVNWNKWNIHLSKIDEDPGCWDCKQPLRDGVSRGAATLRQEFQILATGQRPLNVFLFCPQRGAREIS